MVHYFRLDYKRYEGEDSSSGTFLIKANSIPNDIKEFGIDFLAKEYTGNRIENSMIETDNGELLKIISIAEITDKSFLKIMLKDPDIFVKKFNPVNKN